MAHGWAGPVRDLVTADPRATVHAIADAHAQYYIDAPTPQQLRAWDSELRVLTTTLAAISESKDWEVVLEYELPFEGGRRPDVVLLTGDSVQGIEFKERPIIGDAEVDQAQAYARDLLEYHSACRDRAVYPILCAVRRGGLEDSFEGLTIVGPDRLAGVIRRQAGAGEQMRASDILNGTYAPLPSLIDAARRVWRNEPLPAIRRAHSAGIPRLLEWMHGLVRQAQERHERHLVLITGVPGSGKTLVGLQFVYESQHAEAPDAIFLSGNGPLVEVLQSALHSTVFVRPMHNFILEYGVRRRSPPNHHVIVFDEAQRAWDREQMTRKKEHPRSEPEILMHLAAQLPGWAVVVGLVGEGQEIHSGEDAGLGQWRDAALSAPRPFAVHAPQHLADTFADTDFRANELADLTVSLRTHVAEDVQRWVFALLDGRLHEAASIAERVRGDGFDLYVTDDIEIAKDYARRRYEGMRDKTYGLLASSKAQNLREIGIDNTFGATRNMRPAQWFNAPPEHPRSACQLIQPATEFQAQGLELDLPIVCWGDDVTWTGNSWASHRQTRDARDSHQLRLNSYRVLMSRGRDGVVVFVPSTLADRQSATIQQTLRAAGARDLRADLALSW
ncbi:MAG: DNA/RNA helicase domain-containing protein [Candidatus Limnocylindria bacterium]